MPGPVGLSLILTLVLATYRDNVAHSNLVGLWLGASSSAVNMRCTGIDSFTTYLNWDFGIIPVEGEW